ncbi:MAG: PCP reductase family protein [Polyangiales bacterium]
MSDIHWTPEALKKIERVPFFVRPFAKKKAESEARARGITTITAELLEQLRKAQHG